MTQPEDNQDIVPLPKRDLAERGKALLRRGLTLANRVAAGTFEDFYFYRGNIIRSDVCADGENSVVVSHFGGRIAHIELATKRPTCEVRSAGTNGTTCANFRSLSFESIRRIAAVAADGYAYIWNVGNHSTFQLQPKSYNAVNCVSFSPNGEFLAIGLGYYPLNPNGQSQARVEIWRTGDWSYAGAVSLPGVCVDCISWFYNDHIICFVGAKAQDQGSLAILESPSLEITTCHVLPFAMVRTILLADAESEFIIATHNHGVLALSVSEGFGIHKHMWEFPHADEKCGLRHAVLDKEQRNIILSSGVILRGLDGIQIGQLTPLPDCSCISALGNQRYVGVSSQGLMRIWTLPEAK